jgi:raffinose/stachyose/melibiose transport system permease protein
MIAPTTTQQQIRTSRIQGLRVGGISVGLTTPAIAFYAIFALVPMAIAIYLSFFRWDGLTAPIATGFANWAAITNSVTVHAILLTLEMMALTWVIQTPISLLLGVFMAGPQRYRAVLSVLYFVPLLFSSVAIGITWEELLDPNFGLVNVLLRTIGFGGLAKPWLGDPSITFYVLIGVIAWQFIPFHSLLYLAGARQVPGQLYEAASIDGAGRVAQFFHITLPQLKYTVITSSILMLTGSLTYFDLIWVMTQGGPGYATRILPLQMYIVAFQNEQFGYGSALAVLLAIAGITLSVVMLTVTGFTKMASQMEGL